MKDYIKPAFVLAGLSPVSFNSAGCASTSEDIDLISSIIGVDVRDPKVFATNEESCTVKCDITEYCKYTAVEAGSAKILGS